MKEQSTVAIAASAGLPRVLVPLPTRDDREYNRRNWPAYAAALQQAGAVARVVDPAMEPAGLSELLRQADGIVLPGSPADVDPAIYGADRGPQTQHADPSRERLDRQLLQIAEQRQLPLLGICYGLQSINVYRGGTLVQNLPADDVQHAAGPEVDVAHEVRVEAQSRLQMLLDAGDVAGDGEAGELPVNSSHHQAIERLGRGLQVTARSSADGVIEAVEGVDAEHWIVGVQWHPERSVATSAFSERLFRAFVRAVEERRSRRLPA